MSTSNIIDTIEFGYNYPVDSTVMAIQAYNNDARSGQFDGSYAAVMENLLGDTFKTLPEPHARIHIGYVIQEAVRRHIAGEEVRPRLVYQVATELANDLVKNMPWVFAVKEEEPKLDAQGKPKRKKGAKQEVAARIYQEVECRDKKVIVARFMAELDMTPAGASTYFYNMRKKFGA